ncbi:hypothetical protein H8959_005452 [Pygathrix nigripes]
MPPLPPNLNCRRLTNEKSPCLDCPNIQSQGSFKLSGQSTCWTTVPRSNFGTRPAASGRGERTVGQRRDGDWPPGIL